MRDGLRIGYLAGGLGTEELISLLSEALMRDPTFRPRRRHWAADADRRQLEARMCASGLIDHIYHCGIRWSRLPPAPPHRTT